MPFELQSEKIVLNAKITFYIATKKQFQELKILSDMWPICHESAAFYVHDLSYKLQVST